MADQAKTEAGKPTIIGIYGVQGCGKTTLINDLKKHVDKANFEFYDGSAIIGKYVSPEDHANGLEQFKKMSLGEKNEVRQKAISSIRSECETSGKVGVVAGHYEFWQKDGGVGEVVWSEADATTYTHVIYLEVHPDTVQRRVERDEERPNRTITDSKSLEKWQNDEIECLREVCRTHNILFARLRDVVKSTEGPDVKSDKIKQQALDLLRHFRTSSEAKNVKDVLAHIDRIVKDMKSSGRTLSKLLLVDGDKTLAPQDTGKTFWRVTGMGNTSSGKTWSHHDTSSSVFSSEMGYSHQAFRQVALLYDEVSEEKEFEHLVTATADDARLADKASPHADLMDLVRECASNQDVGAVVVTCGLQRVWEEILELNKVSDVVKVVGCGGTAHPYLVTPEVKAAIVKHLQTEWKLQVIAFGDSPLDIEMLKNADHAFVVVGTEKERSKSMEKVLRDAIDSKGLRAHQVLFPFDAPPRLDTISLPLTRLGPTERQALLDPSFRLSATSSQSPLEVSKVDLKTPSTVYNAGTKSASKFIATRMRDARISGPALRQAHFDAGWYLANEYVGEILGVEPCEIRHVQGNSTEGYQLFHEDNTTVVALMRAGEPMALGVSAVFPKASFVHGDLPVPEEDLQGPNGKEYKRFSSRSNIILVDGVINSGKTVVEYVEHVQKLNQTARIIVVVGILQDQATAQGTQLHKLMLEMGGQLTIIALRTSKNKYPGRGTVDTGHRLFNTTYLD